MSWLKFNVCVRFSFLVLLFSRKQKGIGFGALSGNSCMTFMTGFSDGELHRPHSKPHLLPTPYDGMGI